MICLVFLETLRGAVTYHIAAGAENCDPAPSITFNIFQTIVAMSFSKIDKTSDYMKAIITINLPLVFDEYMNKWGTVENNVSPVYFFSKYHCYCVTTAAVKLKQNKSGNCLVQIAMMKNHEM